MSDDYAGRARALVGTRFRAQGRSPETGLDCVGLVLAAHEIPPNAVPRDYRLRGQDHPRLADALLGFFEPAALSRCRAGDAMLLRVARDQLHLAVRTDSGFVHADARLGRVVETPGWPQWNVLGVYRRRDG